MEATLPWPRTTSSTSWSTGSTKPVPPLPRVFAARWPRERPGKQRSPPPGRHLLSRRLCQRAERSGSGRYRLVFTAPGAFAGRELDDFAFQVHRDSASNDDNHTSVRHRLHRRRLDHRRCAHERSPDQRRSLRRRRGQRLLPDHARGARHLPPRSPYREQTLADDDARCDDRYNTNAAGQRTRVVANPSGLSRIHFAVENDGNTTESLRVRGRAGKGLVKTRCSSASVEEK